MGVSAHPDPRDLALWGDPVIGPGGQEGQVPVSLEHKVPWPAQLTVVALDRSLPPLLPQGCDHHPTPRARWGQSAQSTGHPSTSHGPDRAGAQERCAG